MDNVCHTLVGAALGEAGLKRTTRFGSAALMITANLPDLDVLVFLTDTQPVSFRRGWTHGIAAQVVLPVLFTGVLWAFDRWRGRRGDGAARVHAGWLLILSYVGVYSHVALDYLNTYGIRLLAPFDWRWFYGDAVFIVDPLLWLMLGAGVWLSRRREAVSPSRYALAVATVYIVAMLVSARVARGIVEQAWQDMHGTRPQALMVGPRLLSPFSREVIIDAGPHYERGRFSWPSRLVLDSSPIPKNARRAAVAAAREAPDVEAFLVWSRFPYFTLARVEEGVAVTVGDARFIARGGLFSASAIVAVRGGEGEQ